MTAEATHQEINNRLFQLRNALSKAEEEAMRARARVEAERAQYQEALARAAVEGKEARCSSEGCLKAEAAVRQAEDLLAGLTRAINELEPLELEARIADLRDQNGTDRAEIARLQRELTELEAERERLRGEIRRRGDAINNLSGDIMARESEMTALRTRKAHQAR